MGFQELIQKEYNAPPLPSHLRGGRRKKKTFRLKKIYLQYFICLVFDFFSLSEEVSWEEFWWELKLANIQDKKKNWKKQNDNFFSGVNEEKLNFSYLGSGGIYYWKRWEEKNISDKIFWKEVYLEKLLKKEAI